MYLHARGAGSTQLNRADWRVITYRDVARLGKRDDIDTLDCPEWLRQEIAKFTPGKWLKYWHPRTGKKKVTTKKAAKSRKGKARKQAPAKAEGFPIATSSRKGHATVARKEAGIDPPTPKSASGARKGGRPTITVSVKRVEVSTVKQTFSHGRTKSVIVEKKRRTPLQ